jgi:hypothetical protein
MNPPKHPQLNALNRMAWLWAALFTLVWSAAAADPVVLLTDNFDGTGTPNTMDLNYNLAGRQTGPLGIVGWTPGGNAQVGNAGEHDGGNCLLLAFGASACPLYNFNSAKSAGGLKISFDFDANSHTDWTDYTTWAAITLGASAVDRHTGVNGGGNHFGMLLRANGGLQAFDGPNWIADGNWAPDGPNGNYSGTLHHIDIQITGPGDGNPFDGSGDTQIDVFADGSTTACFSFTKTGGYTDNYFAFQGEHIADIDNLVVTQLDPPTAPTEHWSFAPWTGDADSGVVGSATGNQYTHAYNFSPDRNATINSVVFVPEWAGTMDVANRFLATATPGGFIGWGPAGSLPISGGSFNLAAQFVYNGNPETLTLRALSPGQQYELSLYAWAFGGPGDRIQTFSAGTDQRAIDQHTFGTTGNNGIRITYAYTADASGTLTVNITPLVAGNTFHFSGFANREVTAAPSPWSYAEWTTDANSGISPVYNYTHAYTFGDAASAAVVNTIPFTAAPGANPSVAGQFAVAGVPNPFGVDGANTVTGDSAVLAHSFIYNGFPGSLTVQGLTPGTGYVLSLFSTDWDGGAGARVINFSDGQRQALIDQDAFGPARNGIVISYAYTADASGTLTIQAMPTAGNSFHWYGFANREVTPKPTPPTISLQPVSVTVSEGENVTFSGDAIGDPVPTFEWLKDGIAIDPPETGKTLTLLAVTTANEGEYKIRASNSEGSDTSLGARLTVGLPLPNSSFEADTFPTYPGYANTGLNGGVTDWSFTSTGGYGVNTVAGPFADNGFIPLGNQVLFIQNSGTLSHTVSGLTPGSSYYVSYYENARSASSGTPALQVVVDDGVTAFTVVPAHPITPVGAGKSYRHIDSVGFVANSPTITLSFVKSAWVAGDNTVLIDNVAVVAQPDGLVPLIEQQPQSAAANLGTTALFSVVASGSPFVGYQWYKGGQPIEGATDGLLTLNNVNPFDDDDYYVVLDNGTPVESAHVHLTVIVPLNDLFNTGVGANRAVLPNGTADPHYFITVNLDGDPMAPLVEDTTLFPIVAGPWLGVNTESAWVGPRVFTEGAASGVYTYTITTDLTDRDLSTVFIEGLWASDNEGLGIAVNGVDTGISQDGNFAVWHAFRLDSANSPWQDGVNIIDFKINNTDVGYTGLRVQITSSHGKLTGLVAPFFIRQPQGNSSAIVGDTVVLSANAAGSFPLTYQWYKNGQPIDGQTSQVLTLAGVTANDSGTYTLTVMNEANPTGITSDPALVCVNQQRITVPGLYGTGVDDTGALLPDGAVDPHYLLTASADPGYPGPNAMVVSNGWPIVAGAWALNGPSSKWIAPWEIQGIGNYEGNYTYSTAFDLTGVDLSRFSLRGAWGVDNGAVDVKLNGVSLGTPVVNGFNVLTPFVIPGAVMFGGPNILDITINNAPATPNPTGLRVDIAGYLDVLPTLALTLNADNSVTLTWPSNPCEPFVLQWADSVAPAPVSWNTIDGAVSGYTTAPITPSDPPKFFRLVTP